jgi:hypothetical protein
MKRGIARREHGLAYAPQAAQGLRGRESHPVSPDRRSTTSSQIRSQASGVPYIS